MGCGPSATELRYVGKYEELYSEFVELYLSENKSLEILRHCSYNEAGLMPTWVPDWSFAADGLRLPTRKNAVLVVPPAWRTAIRQEHNESQKPPRFIMSGHGKGLPVNMSRYGKVEFGSVSLAMAQLQPQFLDIVKELMDSGRLIGASINWPDPAKTLTSHDLSDHEPLYANNTE